MIQGADTGEVATRWWQENIANCAQFHLLLISLAFLGEKKNTLQDLQGKGCLFHCKMVLFPSNV